MLLKTILNFVTNYKSFRFGKVSFNEKGSETQHITAEIFPRRNSKATCSECGKKCSTYDTTQTPRRFEFVPLWNIPVFFLYKMRRILVGSLFGCLVYSCDAEQDRADEKVCADVAEASGVVDELVPVAGLVERNGRGFQ